MTPCVSVRLQHKFSDHSDVYQYLSGTSHQFICYSIPFIQYSVYFRYSPKTNMVWTLFHIDLALPSTHSRSWTNIIFFIPLVQKEGRGYFLWISQKCCAIERKSAHESWPDTKKIQSSKTQHCRLCILVFPYLSRHQQYIPTPVAGFGFLFFSFGENRWHPTDRRDMNRGSNSSKSWARQPPSPSPPAVPALALPLALAAQVELDKHHVHISSPSQHQKPLKVDWDFTRSATRSDMEPPRLLFHVFKIQAFLYEGLRVWWNQKLCDIVCYGMIF